MSRESSFGDGGGAVVGYRSEDESEKGDDTPKSLQDQSMNQRGFKNTSTIIKRISNVSSNERFKSVA
jgi:hypothetical protein